MASSETVCELHDIRSAADEQLCRLAIQQIACNGNSAPKLMFLVHVDCDHLAADSSALIACCAALSAVVA